MLDVYKGLGSTGRSLQVALYAKNCRSMKVPVGIDLRRASFTLCQLKKEVGFTMEGGLGFGIGRSSGPITPCQVIVRASVARNNCGWDKEAIFSRSCFLVGLSSPHSDSSFIFLTSSETCTTNISGKLCHNGEHLQVIGTRNDLREGESGKRLVHNIAVGQAVKDVLFSLLLEGWYIVLKMVSQRNVKYERGWSPCLRAYKLTSLTEMGVSLQSNPRSLCAQGPK